jgi:ubiquinone/menaquinone biosynthesis C-methylase UbiE
VTSPPYDRRSIAGIFDTYAEAEWDRHDATPAGRVSFHIHRHYLERYVRAGDRVLEVGAGPGRFMIELARLGAGIVVTDISPRQLELNASHTTAAGVDDRVRERVLADVLDLSRFDDGMFDAVVCYGGPLSWVLDQRDRALDELLRVTAPGGHVLLSVMSRHGSLRAFLPVAEEEIDEFGVQEMQDIVDTGYLPDHHSTLGPMHLFTWDEVSSLLARHACALVAASASSFLSIGNDETCERWLDDAAMWERFLGWEVAVCAQPGALDGGTHIIAVIRATEGRSGTWPTSSR